MDWKSFICAEAQRLGFAAVGFAAAGPSQSQERLAAWLALGLADNLPYLARQQAARAHPENLLPGVKTVIMAAARYPAPARPGAWSALAWGRDYHAVVRGRLQSLLATLRARAPVPVAARICVDSAPLPEREWAVRAGLGWIGPQGSLVHPEYGCCLVLGALLVNLELQPALPLSGGCGSCRLCVAACPTGALRPDGFLDARRCLAALTVEHRGDIPAALRPLPGGALFGCDRCTAVCPRNCRAAEGLLPELAAAGDDLPGPAACLAMSADDFRRRFAGTVVRRLGRERLQRNARAAMEKRHAIV